jgi:hypothetical protein
MVTSCVGGRDVADFVAGSAADVHGGKVTIAASTPQHDSNINFRGMAESPEPGPVSDISSHQIRQYVHQVKSEL